MSDLSRLPVPVQSVWEWQYDGSCRAADPSLFFHPENERGPARRSRDLKAVTICASCPVMERCRQHALDVREPFGVWGGLTESKRQAMRR